MTPDPHGGARLATAGAPPARARLGLVLLHGRGASAADILGLAEHLALPDLAAIAPEAAGHSWWPVSFLAPQAQLEPFLSSALAATDRAVTALVQQGLPRERIALAGFSQGACLAAEYAARTGAPLHSLFVLSGALLGTGDGEGGPSDALYGHAPKRFDYTARLDGVPVYLGCHARDPHIPRARVDDSARVLEAIGAEVRTQIFPGGGHGILAEELAALRARLNAPD